MNSAKILNSISSLLTIAGTIQLWKYGLPSNVSKETHLAAIVIEVDEKEKISNQKEWRKYYKQSRIGLVLVLAGAFLQLVAAWLDD